VTVIVDNCLPVSWAAWLRERGITAQHWREVGLPTAPDTEIMRWALDHGAVVLTHDLDFGTLLFQTRAQLPSVIQLRLDDIRPAAIGETVFQILRQNGAELRSGALVTVESNKSRFRLLPLGG
jgi:predicted nuclease of predicted toxin-antitoxin system